MVLPPCEHPAFSRRRAGESTSHSSSGPSTLSVRLRIASGTPKCQTSRLPPSFARKAPLRSPEGLGIAAPGIARLRLPAFVRAEVHHAAEAAPSCRLCLIACNSRLPDENASYGGLVNQTRTDGGFDNLQTRIQFRRHLACPANHAGCADGWVADRKSNSGDHFSQGLDSFQSLFQIAVSYLIFGNRAECIGNHEATPQRPRYQSQDGISVHLIILSGAPREAAPGRREVKGQLSVLGRPLWGSSTVSPAYTRPVYGGCPSQRSPDVAGITHGEVENAGPGGLS